MAAKNGNKILVYNQSADMLYFSKGKAYSSLDIGSFILDFDRRGFIVGLEVDGASSILGVGKGFLSSLTGASLSAAYAPNTIKMQFALASSKKALSVPLCIDLKHKRATAKAASA